MPQLSDFISRIFSADRTQGLSGGAEVVVDPDPAAAFYASRLRKHRTEQDLVASPEELWTCSSFGGRKGGLRAHIHADRGDGVASFTDVLVVVNEADAARIALAGGQAWGERAAQAVSTRFEAWAQKERFELLYPQRSLAFRFVADGSEDMGRRGYGLGPGEFLTGLLPNYYVAPGRSSRAVVAIHLNIPGAWEGYREVGRLYNDQSLYTLGRHWLDNFSHPALREPGLYRLQQYPDGSLVHVISPEVQDRYGVRSDSSSGGASVLTLSTTAGEPIAYLVLAVVEEEPAPPPIEQGERTASAASAARGTPQRTIVPGAIESRILTLQERGALLQRVHFANFMEGYDVYIGHNGRVGTQIADPKATLQVRGSKVSLVVNDTGVTVEGKAVAVGRPVPLRGEVAIEVDGTRLQYRDLSEVRIEGWPYLGEVRRPGAGAYLEFGGAHRIGRDRRCKVRLPDEPHNENIAWLPTVGGGATIRSRTGDIPKSRFYTDSIMVASEHAELDLTAEPALRSLARHCYTFVRRGETLLPLYPREGATGRHELELTSGDEILVGNCLFQATYLPAGASAPIPTNATFAEAPKILLSPADLASAVDTAPPPSLAAARTFPPVGEDPPGPVEPPPQASSAPAAPSRPSPPPASNDSVTVIRPVVEPPPRIGILPPPPPLPPEEAPPPAPVRHIPLKAVQAPSSSADLGGAGGATPPTTPAPLPRRAEIPPPSPRTTVDVTPAAGLGEGGSAPRPVKLDAPTRRERRPAPPMLVENFEGFPTVSPPTPPTAPADPGSPSAAGPPVASPPEPAPAAAADPAPPAAPGPAPSATADAERADTTTTSPLPAPEPAPPSGDAAEPVVSVEEAQWKVELSRPARLVQVGWSVSGEVVVGNHREAAIVVPEVRAFPEQAFMTLDYFRIYVRGRKTRVELLQEGDARLLVDGKELAVTERADAARLEIVRRDANLEPDFDVGFTLVDEPLPDPRARLLRLDEQERLAVALFTTGCPLRAPRRLRMGGVLVLATFDGETLRIGDYLDTYRVEGGRFRPLFYRSGDKAWCTFPEDGATVVLRPGDRLLAGFDLYELRAG